MLLEQRSPSWDLIHDPIRPIRVPHRRRINRNHRLPQLLLQLRTRLPSQQIRPRLYQELNIRCIDLPESRLDLRPRHVRDARRARTPQPLNGMDLAPDLREEVHHLLIPHRLVRGHDPDPPRPVRLHDGLARRRARRDAETPRESAHEGGEFRRAGLPAPEGLGGHAHDEVVDLRVAHGLHGAGHFGAELLEEFHHGGGGGEVGVGGEDAAGVP